MKILAVQMLILWRLRCGYWDWDAFWVIWNWKKVKKKHRIMRKRHMVVDDEGDV